ncbi:MAG: hypothetical protein ACYSUY_05585 [Planctomycetota bacterium]|jgi:DUF1680 family protein
MSTPSQILFFPLLAAFVKNDVGLSSIFNHSLKPEKGPENGKYTVSKEQDFVVIPYYEWSYRGKGEMTMWLNRIAKGEGN